MFQRIKDKLKFRQALIDRGHVDVPEHHNADFETYVTPLLTMELMSEMSSHFDDSLSFDTGSSIDTSSSFASGSTFDSGGGISGGGGADGSW